MRRYNIRFGDLADEPLRVPRHDTQRPDYANSLTVPKIPPARADRNFPTTPFGCLKLSVTLDLKQPVMIKFTILLKRKPGISHEAFVAHHKDVHADLFLSVPAVKETVRRYVQQHALPVTLPGMPSPKYDGITELWFDDVDALGRCFSDPVYLERIRPDEESFLDLHGCDFIVSSESVVLA